MDFIRFFANIPETVNLFLFAEKGIKFDGNYCHSVSDGQRRADSARA